MIKNKYSKEQIEAMKDLCDEFKKFAHTNGEQNRLQEARANLINRNSYSQSFAKSLQLSLDELQNDLDACLFPIMKKYL